MANFAIGNIGEFSELTENWKSYTERMKQYFMANKIPDGRKVPALLALMGGKTYCKNCSQSLILKLIN